MGPRGETDYIGYNNRRSISVTRPHFLFAQETHLRGSSGPCSHSFTRLTCCFSTRFFTPSITNWEPVFITLENSLGGRREKGKRESGEREDKVRLVV